MTLRMMLVMIVMSIVTSACSLTPSTPSQDAPMESVLPPILVEIQNDTLVANPPASMNVGEVFVFAGESAGWTITTTTPELVDVSQGGDQGSFTTNPGFTATAKGSAVITATSPAGAVITVNIVIK